MSGELTEKKMEASKGFSLRPESKTDEVDDNDDKKAMMTRDPFTRKYPSF